MTTNPNEPRPIALGDDGETLPRSNDAPVPGWLFWTYVLLPFWGILWFSLFWNGSFGWLDRGAWAQLQEVANTTFPLANLTEKADP